MPGCVNQGRMGKEETMKRNPSDLPFGTSDPGVIVVRSQNTEKFVSKDDFLDRGDKFFNEILKDITTLSNLVHGGSFKASCYVDEDERGLPLRIRHCGGMLTFSTNINQEGWHKNYNRGGSITCTGLCGMDLVTRLPINELKTAMLHLALKQMLPDLPMCNYIDCSQAKPLNWRSEDKKEIEDVHALGLVSLLYKSLLGNLKDVDSFVYSIEDWGIGFILMPGMNTLNSSDGFDEWLRFLINKKFEQIKKHHNKSLSALLGPKPYSSK